MTNNTADEDQKKSSFGQEDDGERKTDPKQLKDLFIKAIIGAVAVTLAAVVLMLAWPKIEQMKSALDEKRMQEMRYRNCSFNEEQQNARDVFCP
jgi:hypothetical protein